MGGRKRPLLPDESVPMKKRQERRRASSPHRTFTASHPSSLPSIQPIISSLDDHENEKEQEFDDCQKGGQVKGDEDPMQDQKALVSEPKEQQDRSILESGEEREEQRMEVKELIKKQKENTRKQERIEGAEGSPPVAACVPSQQSPPIPVGGSIQSSIDHIEKQIDDYRLEKEQEFNEWLSKLSLSYFVAFLIFRTSAQR